MVVMQILQWITGIAVVIIGLGIVGLIANSVAHCQACKVEAARIAAAARVAPSPAVPALPPMEDEAPPEWAAVPAPESPDMVELLGVMGMLHEAPDGIRGLFKTGRGQFMPVLIPRYILRVPDDGERVTVRGVVEGQVLHVASWCAVASEDTVDDSAEPSPV